MTSIMKYTLSQITDISFSGLNFEIPEDTVAMINYLCANVGSDGLKNTVFQKNESLKSLDHDNQITGFKSNSKKRKGNKAMEISSEEWETLRSFQATKIEQKTGINGEIDQIRLLLNKLTDKTYLDIREKIIAKISSIWDSSPSEEELIKIGKNIYDLSSTNKFYSKIFADVYAELATLYKWLMPVFEEKYENIMEQYKNIQYIDPDKDYDGFCDMNKINENRRAITTFFVNLALNGFISKDKILEILTNILIMVDDNIKQADKKNEVDELTENIAILFSKEIIDSLDEEDDKYYIYDKSIIETINHLAKSKAKDYPSLSNKAIFKYMDLVEM